MTTTRLLPLVLLMLGCSSSTDAGASTDAAPKASAAESAEAPDGDSQERPLRAPPGTPRGPDQADTDEKGFPKDAADYLTGPMLRGTLRDGETGDPIKGCTVSEHGATAEPVRTKGKGVFELKLANELRPAVLALCDGYVPTLQVVDDQSRLYFDGEFKIELFARAEEDAASLEDFGHARSADKAVVVMNFQPQGLPAGVKAVLAAEGAVGWVYAAAEKPTKGDTFGADPGVGEIAYPELAPAEAYTVTLTSPEPLECGGPLELPALADTTTRGYYFCSRPGDAPRGPKAK